MQAAQANIVRIKLAFQVHGVPALSGAARHWLVLGGRPTPTTSQILRQLASRRQGLDYSPTTGGTSYVVLHVFFVLWFYEYTSFLSYLSSATSGVIHHGHSLWRHCQKASQRPHPYGYRIFNLDKITFIKALPSLERKFESINGLKEAVYILIAIIWMNIFLSWILYYPIDSNAYYFSCLPISFTILSALNWCSWTISFIY